MLPYSRWFRNMCPRLLAARRASSAASARSAASSFRRSWARSSTPWGSTGTPAGFSLMSCSRPSRSRSRSTSGASIIAPNGRLASPSRAPRAKDRPIVPTVSRTVRNVAFSRSSDLLPQEGGAVLRRPRNSHRRGPELGGRLPQALEPRQDRALDARRELHWLLLLEDLRQERHCHLGNAADRLSAHAAGSAQP